MDVRTIAAMTGLSHVLQLVALALLFSTRQVHRGTGWWLLWSSSVAAGFGCMLLREIPSLRVAAILAQNSLLILGVAFLYVGLMRFHGRTENRVLLAAILVPYLSCHAIFLVLVDDITVRSLLFDVAMALVSLLIVRDLLRVRRAGTRASANFLCLVLSAHALLFAWRGALVLAGAYEHNVFSPSASNVLPYLDAFVVGNLLAFGLVVLSNQLSYAEMEEARDHFQLLFHESPDAVLITRAADGLCRDANEGFELLSGFRREEIVGRTGIDLQLYEDPADRESLAAALREKGSVGNRRIPFRRKDGSLLVGSLSARLLPLDGVPHFLTVTRDVTEQSRAEEEVRRLNTDLESRVASRTAELEAALREMEGFSYSVAHDLRAPIRAVHGFATRLEKGYGRLLDEEGRRLLDVVEKAARQMGTLIDDLLRFSQLGRTPLESAPIDMSALVESVLADLLPVGERERLEVRREALPRAEGDGRLVRVVWTNLVSNAIKFSAGRDRPLLEIGSRPAPEGPAYFVRDNGVGFDPRYGHKLFGVFERLHGVDAFPGTGIGLALVRRLVERHGGRAWAEGEPDRGATFWFTLGPGPAPR